MTSICSFPLCLESVFEQSPKNTTAGLGFPAVFECAAVAQPDVVAMAWFVDGTSAITPEIADRNITAISQQLPSIGGTLTVPATEANNNTEIVCRIITISDRIDSTPAILAIQGIKAVLIVYR